MANIHDRHSIIITTTKPSIMYNEVWGTEGQVGQVGQTGQTGHISLNVFGVMNIDAIWDNNAFKFSIFCTSPPHVDNICSVIDAVYEYNLDSNGEYLFTRYVIFASCASLKLVCNCV